MNILNNLSDCYRFYKSHFIFSSLFAQRPSSAVAMKHQRIGGQVERFVGLLFIN